MSITSSNANITVTIPLLYPTPQKFQMFAADDVYDTEALEMAEVSMGVDGVLSGGYVYNPVTQGFSFQADSPSLVVIDNWIAAQRTAGEIYNIYAITILPGINKKYAHTKGFLKSAPILPDAKKMLQPRKVTIVWQSVLPAKI